MRRAGGRRGCCRGVSGGSDHDDDESDDDDRNFYSSSSSCSSSSPCPLRFILTPIITALILLLHDNAFTTTHNAHTLSRVAISTPRHMSPQFHRSLRQGLSIRNTRVLLQPRRHQRPHLRAIVKELSSSTSFESSPPPSLSLSSPNTVPSFVNEAARSSLLNEVSAVLSSVCEKTSTERAGRNHQHPRHDGETEREQNRQYRRQLANKVGKLAETAMTEVADLSRFTRGDYEQGLLKALLALSTSASPTTGSARTPPSLEEIFERAQLLQRLIRRTGVELLSSSSPSSPSPSAPSSSPLSVTFTPSGEVHVEGMAFPLLQTPQKSNGTIHIFPEVSNTEGKSLILGVSSPPVTDRPERAIPPQASLELGPLKAKRWLAIARQKLWWMSPTTGSFGERIPDETQCLLAEVEMEGKGESGGVAYVLLLPLVDQVYRSSLYGTGSEKEITSSSPAAAELSSLQLVLESGDPFLSSQTVPASLYIAAGLEPYSLMERGVREVSKYLDTFRPREAKRPPQTLDVFGWCTWDAFYSKVEPNGVRKGVKLFEEAQLPVKMLILDDGWQATQTDRGREAEREMLEAKTQLRQQQQPPQQPGKEEEQTDARAEVDVESLEGGGVVGAEDYAENTNPASKLLTSFYQSFVSPSALDSIPVRLWRWLTNGPLQSQLLQYYDEATDWSKRLASIRPNAKFAPLDAFAKGIKRDSSVEFVYCWHALLGYWLGVDPKAEEMQSFNASIKYPCIQPVAAAGYDANILKVEPSLAWTPSTFLGVGMVEKAQASRFYDEFHAFLNQSGVDGVKVDAQSVLSVLGTAQGGGASVTRTFVNAMENGVSTHLSNNLIGCMAHAGENLFAMRSTPVLRASDDFYPKDERSHGQHVTSVAYNSVLLGEFATPDWDCFLSKHPFGELHASARAVGGCPVYVSDRVGEFDYSLLSRLVLPDGSVYRARLPGRPTRDSLFADIQRDRVSCLKIWNVNNVTGVVAAFNVQGQMWDRQRHDYYSPFGHGEELPFVQAHVKPDDVESGHLPPSPVGRYALYAHGGGDFMVTNGEVDDGMRFLLSPNASEIITVSPVYELVNSKHLIAPLGCRHFLNGGGAVEHIQIHSGKNEAYAGSKSPKRGIFSWIASGFSNDRNEESSRVRSSSIESPSPRSGASDRTDGLNIAASSPASMTSTHEIDCARLWVRGVGKFSIIVSAVPNSVVLLTDDSSVQENLEFTLSEIGEHQQSVSNFTMIDIQLPEFRKISSIPTVKMELRWTGAEI